jgi:hypothetical protein
MKEGVELVCVDCGRAVNPVEALDIHLARRVVKVCPSCHGGLRPADGSRL